MSQLVPPPPDPFEPVLETWPAGLPLWRVHPLRRGAAEFNPGMGEPTRFAFFGSPVVPVLYAGANPEAAVAETLLHDLGGTGGFLPHEIYRGRVLSEVRPIRDLTLVQLHGGGLIKLGLEAQQLTATTAAHYPETVAWAQAAHRGVATADGLVWMSRRWNSARCVMLFGDRVAGADLEVEGGSRRQLDSEEAFLWLADLCATIGVDVQPPPPGEWVAGLLSRLGEP